MPALRAFVLGVGHMRRKGMQRRRDVAGSRRRPCSRRSSISRSATGTCSSVLKRDFAPDEIGERMWERRARAAGIDPATFFDVAEDLDRARRHRPLLHVPRAHEAGGRRTSACRASTGSFTGPCRAGREIEAGCEIGRFAILTHCYWRDAGPELNDVNIMAVAHGETKEQVMAHKAAIDAHLDAIGIGFTYTNVYWGGRAEIKPSEISPVGVPRVGADEGSAMNASDRLQRQSVRGDLGKHARLRPRLRALPRRRAVAAQPVRADDRGGLHAHRRDRRRSKPKVFVITGGDPLKRDDTTT